MATTKLQGLQRRQDIVPLLERTTRIYIVERLRPYGMTRMMTESDLREVLRRVYLEAYQVGYRDAYEVCASADRARSLWDDTPH